jgi:hypothetical protein
LNKVPLANPTSPNAHAQDSRAWNVSSFERRKSAGDGYEIRGDCGTFHAAASASDKVDSAEQPAIRYGRNKRHDAAIRCRHARRSRVTDRPVS